MRSEEERKDCLVRPAAAKRLDDAVPDRDALSAGSIDYDLQNIYNLDLVHVLTLL